MLIYQLINGQSDDVMYDIASDGCLAVGLFKYDARLLRRDGCLLGTYLKYLSKYEVPLST